MVLRLYVSGETAGSEKLAARLRRGCEEMLRGEWELEVVDVRTMKRNGEAHPVLATPMLERREPKPVRRVVGDLRDAESVLEVLEVTRQAEPRRETERRSSDLRV